MEPFAGAVRHVSVSFEAAAQSGAGRPALSRGEAFEDLYANQREPMVRLAHLIVGSNAVAEEIAQEAFVRVHDRWERTRNPGAYLRVTVLNLCRSHLRRLRLERSRTPPMPTMTDMPELDETWNAVCRLPYRQRAVLVLRYYLDLPEAEIAEALRCRVGTVKSAHHRAIAALRKELA